MGGNGDADINPTIYAHDVYTSNVPTECVEDHNNDDDGAVQLPPNGYTFANSTIDTPDECDDDSQAIDQPAEHVEHNNNDNDGAMPLSSATLPQFNSLDRYAVLSVPINATTW